MKKLSCVQVAITALLLCALLCLAAAQESKEKVAFYLSGKEPKAGIYKPLRGFITKAIVNSGTYMAVDRTEEVVKLIAKEQTYQRTGAVDDAQISELGKQWGAKYVVAIEATKSIDGFYLEAKMVDVEKAYVAKMGEATSKLTKDDDLRVAADKIIGDLGIGGMVSTGGGSYFAQKNNALGGLPGLKKTTIKLSNNSKVEIHIPSSFDVMPEKMLKRKYPNENRPKVVYSNEDGTVNVGFNHTAATAESGDLPKFMETFKTAYTNLYPTATWYRSGLEKVNGKEVGVMELITPAIDTEVYNLIWFTDIGGRLALFTFNCTKGSLGDWKETAGRVMGSFREL